MLKVENIRKSFGKTEVLKGIGFSLEKGDVLAIIGSSGSGKTTLLRCLNFLTAPDEGRIIVNGKVLIDGADKHTLSEKQIRRNRLHFGLVFQQFNLFPQYTVTGNITLAARLRQKERIKDLKKLIKNCDDPENKAAYQADLEELTSLGYELIEKRTKELIERVGLTERADAYPCELSGGQQQRVAIARALSLAPDILCFDEPTSALDPELTGEVLNVIRSLKTGDSTMIVVTHEMEFAKAVSDKVIYMADGIIEEMGTPKELFEAPKSDKLKKFLEKALK
ncbi:MAG: amino acid ABC transporter ATP-binding protein [Lachnospiraceae bacterium]|nr:amino acid ABC transporter ATP-binding protein [Lachnospiraceae bacterium]